MHSLIVKLLLAFAFAAAAIAVFDRVNADWSFGPGEFADLTAAETFDAYEQVVFQHARVDKDSKLPAPENTSIWPLRAQMLIDSLALEPAYAGLLVLYVLVLRRRARGSEMVRWDWPLQCACLTLAAGVMFDLAENGMTIRAAEDALQHLLAQPTVDDVHQASQLKWAFLGAATLMVGLFARDRRLVANTALKLGSWAAILVAPLAVVQAIHIRFDPTVDQWLALSLLLAFAIALAALGVGLEKVRTDDAPRGTSPRVAH